MYQGKVQWFNAPKGYGFIRREDGEEFFVHYSGISMDGYRKLEQGDCVVFNLRDGKQPGRMEACDVTKAEA